MPKVSLVMPVYNGEEFVADAIDSVLGQSFDSFELIIINDGSVDGSEAVIRRYLQHDSIEYFCQENRGVTATTNRGIKLASGEYLAIHPQDDVSYPERLERQVSVLENNPGIGFVYSPALFVDIQGEELGLWGEWRGRGRISKDEMFRKLYVDGNFLASPSVLFRRNHITDGRHPWGDPDLKIVSDWEHWLEASQYYGAYEMGEPMIEMLRDEGHDNLSSRRESVLSEEKIVLRRCRRRFAKGDPPVTRRMYAEAMSNHYLRELRYHLHQERDFSGSALSTLKSFAYNPFNAGLYREYAKTVYRLV